MNDATEFRSVTFQLHPGTRARHRKLAQIAGACRYVWNHFLACNRRDHATYKLRKLMFDAGLLIDKPSPPSLSFQSMGVRFTALRRETPNRKSQSEFKCVYCGHTGNADVNAALNIMASATGAAGRRGALALATPMNRQNVYRRRAA